LIDSTARYAANRSATRARPGPACSTTPRTLREGLIALTPQASSLGTILLLSRFVSQKFVAFVTKGSKEDLTIMRDLMKAGKVTPVIDKHYRLSEVPEAIGYLEQGHARGKVVITI
jgi:D-arabinose 1-dehydrogenase-like Zn-dependent alcohol dehydrogenase